MKRAFLLILSALSLSASAEENVFTLGVDTRCIYGLAPCWSKVREPVSLVDGVSWVSDTAVSTEWTGQFKTTGGKLPDLAGMKELMHRFNGDQFTVRGIEGTLLGKVEKRLEALKRKVQWNVRAKKDVEMSAAEQSAFVKLKVESTSASRAAKLTGPLRSENGGWVMEVREFFWR